MSLFSSILKGIGAAVSEAKKFSETADTSVSMPSAETKTDNGTANSGKSWGPTMPSEENQYSFNGTYEEYFESIFNAEFSQYKTEKKSEGRSLIYTFSINSEVCLVVELLSRKSSSQKLRSDCASNGIPYLRFYYDFHGWWNTRSYVADRMKNAIKK